MDGADLRVIDMDSAAAPLAADRHVGRPQGKPQRARLVGRLDEDRPLGGGIDVFLHLQRLVAVAVPGDGRLRPLQPIPPRPEDHDRIVAEARVGNPHECAVDALEVVEPSLPIPYVDTKPDFRVAARHGGIEGNDEVTEESADQERLRADPDLLALLE